MKTIVEREIAGRNFSLTTGVIGKQASGCLLIQYGETVAIVAAQGGPGRPGIDFFPLTVDYRERLAAAGKFPGGFLKREGRPTQREILTCRLTDRPIRPLFPKGYRDEVQIQINVLACDKVNDPDILAITGASAALSISELPFDGPIAGVRVGLIDGELILMPTYEQTKESELDLVVAGSKDSILMIEGFGNQIPEDQMTEALMFGHKAIQELCEMQVELAEKAGKEKIAFEPPPENPFTETVKSEAYDRIKEARLNPKKQERSAARQAIKEDLIAKHFPDDATVLEDGRTVDQLKQAISALDYHVCRELTVSGQRLDGRGATDLRNVECEVGLIPRVHGSAVFTRGETQSLNTVVLGSARDRQRVDSLFEETSKSFMLDYNFPSYSVGEVRPIRGPGRREIGHGMLAERSLERIIPTQERFPYTVRVISDITESNGSSSMATVCSTTLSLMDAGVPIVQPVAGISIGLVKDGDKHVILTDIMGDEDHFGDMDFKIAGTGKGDHRYPTRPQDRRHRRRDHSQDARPGQRGPAGVVADHARRHSPAARRRLRVRSADQLDQDRSRKDRPADRPRWQDDSRPAGRDRLDDRHRRGRHRHHRRSITGAVERRAGPCGGDDRGRQGRPRLLRQGHLDQGLRCLC